MKLAILIPVGFLVACALPHPSGGELSLSPRRPVVVTVDGRPQQRDVWFRDVHAGQVVVAGIWTVIFSVEAADMVWIRDLAARNESVALEWDSRSVWSFGATSDGDGYFIDRGFNDEATARRVADEIKTKQGVSGK